MTNPDIDLKKLPQKALRQIRALAKGNGVEPDSIQIKEAKGEVIRCEAITHIELHSEIVEERKKGRVQAGQVLDGPAETQKAINDYVVSAIKNDETRKYLANILLERPDKGYAIHAEYFDVAPLNRDYCYYEPCGTCEGQANVKCSRCGGQRREVCSQCHGRTMTPCTYCHGSGFTKTPDGKQIQCNRCFGQRQVACKLCQKTGSISCRQCKGSGATQCNTCRGAAFFTVIAHVILKMKTLFEIDRAALPHPAVKIIEDNGQLMAAKGHISLEAQQVKREDGGLAIQYNTTFPYGDLIFTLNGKPLKTHLFGYKGKMLKLPNFIDTIIEQNFQTLIDAANGEGNIANKIRRASKTRFIAEALLLSITQQPKKAMLALKQKYPIGASNDQIKNAIVVSNKALANVTRKTRMGGLIVGSSVTALLNAIYLFSPARTILEPLLPSPAIIIFDILLIGLGGLITNKAIAHMAKRPLKSALGPLLPNTQRGKFKPKTQNPFWAGYVISIIMMMVIIFAAKFLNGTVPSWFPF